MNNSEMLTRILDKMKADILREAEEKQQATEERKNFYEKVASLLSGQKATVQFCAVEPHLNGDEAIGSIDLLSSGYDIRLFPGMPLVLEHSVFCHEASHAILKHPTFVTPIERRATEIVWLAYHSAEFKKKVGTAMAEACDAAHVEREAEANTYARKIFSVLFRGEVYQL